MELNYKSIAELQKFTKYLGEKKKKKHASKEPVSQRRNQKCD